MTRSPYLTTQEVAALLRIRERKVYELVHKGQIPVSRVTGKLLYSRSLIEDWINERTEYVGDLDALRLLPDIMAGSHDPLLEWALRESRCGMALVLEGSSAGLERLAARKAAAAGLHIHEPETGGWNRVHVAQTPGFNAGVLISWARRRQGLIVARGNPLEIRHVSDLGGHRVIARQEGSGSQLLLSRLVADAGLEDLVSYVMPPASSELDVALAIATGKADAGLAIEAVARQSRLDFVPIVWESFDIAVWRRAYFEEPFQLLLSFARTDQFQLKARELGGYDIADLGSVRYNGRT